MQGRSVNGQQLQLPAAPLPKRHLQALPTEADAETLLSTWRAEAAGLAAAEAAAAEARTAALAQGLQVHQEGIAESARAVVLHFEEAAGVAQALSVQREALQKQAVASAGVTEA